TAVWAGKAQLTRVLERRHADARAAGTEHATSLNRLRAIRRRTEQLVQDARLKPTDRDQLLAALADERDRLERHLAAAVPALRRWRERAALGADDLRRALPAGTVCIDLLAYRRDRADPMPKTEGIPPWVPSYVAFVVAAGQPVRRVELGAAGPIDA